MGTMKVKPWGKGQGDHVIINEEKFDPKIHQKFEPAQEPAAAPKKPAPKEEAKPATEAKQK